MQLRRTILLLGRSVKGLPSAVSVRQIRTGHVHFGPGVEVPDGIIAITVGAALDLFAEHVEIFVDRQRVVRVVGRHKVSHRTRRNAQGTTD